MKKPPKKPASAGRTKPVPPPQPVPQPQPVPPPAAVPPAPVVPPPGRGIEGKYGVISCTGKQFHPGEPLFLFRATDTLAPATIRDYAMRAQVVGCSDEFVNAIKRHADRIAEWQVANPELVKQPD